MFKLLLVQKEMVVAEAESLLGQGYIRETGRINENGTVTETFVKPVSVFGMLFI